MVRMSSAQVRQEWRAMKRAGMHMERVNRELARLCELEMELRTQRVEWERSQERKVGAA